MSAVITVAIFGSRRWSADRPSENRLPGRRHLQRAERRRVGDDVGAARVRQRRTSSRNPMRSDCRPTVYGADCRTWSASSAK